MTEKGPAAFRTISEAGAEVGAPAHVLRFWESKFSFIRPVRRPGGQRFYRPRDIALLSAVRRRLHDDGLSIRQVQALSRAALLEGQGEVVRSARRIESLRPSANRDGLRVALGELLAAKLRLDRLLAH